MRHQLESEAGVGRNPTVFRLWALFTLLLVFGHESAQEEGVDFADQDGVIPTENDNTSSV